MSTSSLRRESTVSLIFLLYIMVPSTDMVKYIMMIPYHLESGVIAFIFVYMFMLSFM